MLSLLAVFAAQVASTPPAIPVRLADVAAVFRDEGTTVTPTVDGFIAARGATSVAVAGGVDCPAKKPANVQIDDPGTVWFAIKLRAVHSSGGESSLASTQGQQAESCAQLLKSEGVRKQFESFRDQAWAPTRATPTLATLLTPALADRGTVDALSADERARWAVDEAEAFVVVVGDRRLLVTGTATCTAESEFKPGDMATFTVEVKAKVRDKEKKTVVGMNTRSILLTGMSCENAQSINAARVASEMKILVKSIFH